jgi:D-xylose transport system permease protein
MNRFKSQLRTYAMVLALFAIWIIFNHYTGGSFLEPRNISNLLRQMSVTGILAGAMVLVIVTGEIDLSVGSLCAFLGGIFAVLSSQHGLSPMNALLITVACGLVVGFAQGFLTAYQLVPSFIVTLGGMMAFRGASMWVTSNSTIPLDESWIMALSSGYLDSKTAWPIVILVLAIASVYLVWSELKTARNSWSVITAKVLILNLILIGAMLIFSSYQGVPYPVLLMALILILLNFLASSTIWGRHLYATGGNKEAAFLSGVNVKFCSLTVMTLIGVMSSVAGIVLTARVGSASPDAGQLLELDAIASCVIGGTSLVGGKGTVFGAVLGALLIESLNNGMSLANMEPFWQYILKGLVLVTAVWVDVASREVK